MKSKVTATAENGTLTEMVVQGETTDLYGIWGALTMFVAKRMAKDLNRTTSSELAVMADYLMGLSEWVCQKKDQEREKE